MPILGLILFLMARSNAFFVCLSYLNFERVEGFLRNFIRTLCHWRLLQFALLITNERDARTSDTGVTVTQRNVKGKVVPVLFS